MKILIINESTISNEFLYNSAASSVSNAVIESKKYTKIPF